MNIPPLPVTTEQVVQNDRMKPRLLVSDPDPVLLQIYRAYLSKFGFDVATAASGPECLDQLRNLSPDLLVLSLELRWGGADGVLSIMREDSEMRPIPVVLTVGEVSRLQADQHLVHPVVSFVAQPFQLHDLRSTLEAALSDGHFVARQDPLCR